MKEGRKNNKGKERRATCVSVPSDVAIFRFGHRQCSPKPLEGRKEEGRKEGRKEGKKEGLYEGRKEGRQDYMKEGRTIRRKEGRKDYMKEGRKS